MTRMISFSGKSVQTAKFCQLDMAWAIEEAFQTVYEGEGGGGGESGGSGEGGGGGNDDPDLPPELKGKTSFNQAEVNAIMKKDRVKYEAQLAKERADKERHIKNLETIQKTANLTEKEKAGLTTQIEELKSSLLTKEQLAASQQKKIKEEHEGIVKNLTNERDIWQSRFTTSMIKTAIVSAASAARAFDSDNIVAILGPSVRLHQEIDPETNQPTEQFTPKVKFNDTDKDNKPVVVDFTIEQAVNRMRELPKYKHLFETDAKGGLGGNSGSGKPGATGKDPAKMTPEEYRKYRAELGMGRRRSNET